MPETQIICGVKGPTRGLRGLIDQSEFKEIEFRYFLLPKCQGSPAHQPVQSTFRSNSRPPELMGIYKFCMFKMLKMLPRIRREQQAKFDVKARKAQKKKTLVCNTALWVDQAYSVCVELNPDHEYNSFFSTGCCTIQENT